jgi:ATP-dependent Clp protease ATP-binding subunit ClpA
VGAHQVLRQGSFGSIEPVDLVDKENKPIEFEPPGISPSDLPQIRQHLDGRITGQKCAIDCVFPWIKRLAFGLFREDKPAATFLFVGRTGVGKTLLARELARIIHGNADSLVMFDMGQFQYPSDVVMLLGAPQGYIGANDGRLVNAIRDMPNAVLCFDEIDKAGQQALDVLLRMVDRGFVRDATGIVYDARRTVVVFVTNCAGTTIPKSTVEQMCDSIRQAARESLPAELIARVDEIVCFVPFSHEASRQVVDAAVEHALKSFEARGLRVVVHEDVRLLIARELGQRQLQEGARAASRLIQTLLVEPIINYALSHEAECRDRPAAKIHAHLDTSGKVAVVAENDELL